MQAVIKLGGVVLLAALSTQASAERIFGLTTGNSIVTFDSASPNTITSSGAIGGLAGDTLTGIDLRPANNTLYSIGASGNLYAITKNASGVDYTATSLGAITTAPSGSSFGIDFNPTVDRLRVISDTNQNLRVNPNVMPPAATVDTPISLNGVAGGGDLIAAAYTNSRIGATTTTLYAIDATGNSLVRSTNPNGGLYVTTNLAGANFLDFGFNVPLTSQFGFDISGATGTAFFNSLNSFGTVNLTTGRSTIIGTVGAGNLTGIAAGAVPEPAMWAMMIAGFGLVGAAMRRRDMASVAA